MDMAEWPKLKSRIKFKDAKQVLIVRDPYNWAASCLNRLRTTRNRAELDVAENIEARMRQWKVHAKIALNPPSDLIVVNYNKWFTDEKYRHQLADQLGIPATDEGLNDIPRYGQGSSFTKRRLDGQAQQMPVLERYVEWKDHKRFKSLMDDEVHRLAKELFNMEI
jgi:hypothetical protein